MKEAGARSPAGLTVIITITNLDHCKSSPLLEKTLFHLNLPRAGCQLALWSSLQRRWSSPRWDVGGGRPQGRAARRALTKLSPEEAKWNSWKSLASSLQRSFVSCLYSLCVIVCKLFVLFVHEIYVSRTRKRTGLFFTLKIFMWMDG